MRFQEPPSHENQTTSVMSKLYQSSHRTVQQKFNTLELADQIEAAVVREELSDDHSQFISSQTMFFLSTIDESSRPTVSYKGGAAGFVRILNATQVMFPSYDGNGMFYSMGNILANPEIGMLFVDFETPNRLRIQGKAELVSEGPLLDSYPGANLVVKIALSQVWINCSRYVHKMTLSESSPYVPDSSGNAPIALWKRIEGLDHFLGERDKQLIQEAGYITQEEYEKKLSAGETS